MNDIFKNWNWTFPQYGLKISCIDMHTGGEPVRIPVSGLPKIEGNTILEKRSFFKSNYDHLRRGLMWEPRGHADMYGAVLLPTSIDEADFDVLFLHNEGYSTMCGHAILALTKFVFVTGLKSIAENNSVKINTPAGVVTASAQLIGKEVVKCSFINVPSFVVFEEEHVEVPGVGKVKFDLVFGGAFYAIVSSGQFHLSLYPNQYQKMIELGRKIKDCITERFEIRHPAENDLGFLYGTIFTGPSEDPENHSRNVCIFADGELDRSPTGTGVSARAALHYHRGEIDLHEPVIIESILGTTMTVKAIEEVDFHDWPAVIPEVSGQAHFTGEHTFYFDQSDPQKDGFIFR